MTDAERLNILRHALQAAKLEIEWWVDEHACCAGREADAMAVIDAALREGGDK